MHWLLGRVVAKDAVRAFVRQHSGVTLYPADIEIVTDEYGQPHVSGEWLQQTTIAPRLSIAHIDGVGVAVAGDAARYSGVGVDVEHLGQSREGFEWVAFTPEEENLLSSLDMSQREEWSIRLWCAKEAVAKALARGMLGGPRSLVVQQFDVYTGVVKIALAGELAKQCLEHTGVMLTAYTSREGNLILASTWLERSEDGEGGDGTESLPR
jgi:phosphopantetheinyl transferase